MKHMLQVAELSATSFRINWVELTQKIAPRGAIFITSCSSSR